MTSETTPHLDLTRPSATPRAVILVLHGGKEHSREPVLPKQSAVLRMAPFARDLAALGADLVVARLRYRVRGWNGTGDDALADVAFALAALDDRFGTLPVVLVGHSMGGRAAMRAAGHASVRGVVALAPWLPDGEPVEQLAGRDVVVLHGTRDRTTNPKASARFVHRATPVARRAVFVAVPWSGHGMILRASTWHRLTAAFTAALVDDALFTRAFAVATSARCRADVDSS